MVFARELGDELAGLVKELDRVVAANEEEKMASLVNILGEDAEKAQEQAAQFAVKNKVTQSAVVVPSDSKDGPGTYGIAADAAITVMLYRGKRVEAVHAFAEGELSKDKIAAVVSDTKKILIGGAGKPPNFLWQLAVGGGLVGCLLIALTVLLLIRSRLAR